METKPDLEIPGITFGPLLGRGASGEVWAGTMTGSRVAVKLLDLGSDWRTAFDEAGALARVKHQNIVTIHGVHRVADRVVVVMDRLELTLGQLLNVQGSLRGAQVVGLITDVAAGLQEMHENELTHGDISLTNIGFSLDGVAQLLDFGAVRDGLTLGSFEVDFAESGAIPPSADVRIERLLGGQGRQIHPEAPAGIQRRRRDVLALARIGLIALGSSGRGTGSGTKSAGSVAETISEVLRAQIREIESGQGRPIATPLDIAAAVSTVIPRAPITIPRLEDSVDPVPLQVGTTRRAAAETAKDACAGHEFWGAPVATEKHTRAAQTSNSRKRLPHRTLVLSCTVAIGLAAIGGGFAIGTAEQASSHRDAPRQQGTEVHSDARAREIAHWQRIVTDLSRVRDAALVAGDLAALNEVNAPNSPAAAHDSELLANLRDSGVIVTELVTTSTVREVLIADDQSATLAVETGVVSQQQEYQDEHAPVRSGSAAQYIGEQAPVPVEIELVQNAGEWRVAEIRKSRAAR